VKINKFFNGKWKTRSPGLAAILAPAFLGAALLAGCSAKAKSIEGNGGNYAGANAQVVWAAAENTGFAPGDKINAVAFGGGQFVAVGGGGKAAYSADGITWTAVGDTKFDDSDIEAIAWGGGKFVAVGGEGKAAYSSDGITWTAAGDTKLGDCTIYAIAYGGDKFVAGGDEGAAAYSSDGAEWTAIGDTRFDGYNPVIAGIAYGNGRFVAVGDTKGMSVDDEMITAKAAYSNDGITWTEISDTQFGYPYSSIKGIAWGGGKFVAVGGEGKAAYSEDGITWTAVDDTKFNGPDDTEAGAEDYTINGITYGAGKFVAVGGCGGKGGAYGAASYSTDGVTWFPVTDTKFGSPDEPQDKLSINGIAYGSGKFVAVGDTDNEPAIAYWEDDK